MRTRSISTATALAVLFGSAALAVGTAGSASADSAKIISVKSVGDMVVDGSHQRVYLSDPTGGKIVVTDYAGTVTATLTGLPGVTGLALSADSGQVYAAVKGTDRILSVDTKTSTPSASYDLTGADAPTSLEIVDGRLWFGYADGLGSLDISGAEPVVKLDLDGTTFSGPPILAADPAVPGVLATGLGDDLAVFDVSADGAVLRASGRLNDPPEQIDLTPDGKQVLASWDSVGGYGISEFSTTSLAYVGGYPTGPYPNAVAVAPDGTVAGGSFSWYDPDVHVFKAGDRVPTRQYDFPNTGNSSGSDTLVGGALAWAPDRSRVFAVSENNSGTFTLRTLTDPTREVPSLSVSAPATAARAKALTVTGKLTSKTPVPVGTALTVTRKDADYPSGKTLASVRTTSGGGFSFADTPSAGGNVTYTVRYAGDAAHLAATASDTVAVTRATPVLTLNNNGRLYDYGTNVVFTAHLGTTYTNRTVEIWADPYGTDRPSVLLKSGKVNSGGNLSVALAMNRDATVTAVFKGDARYIGKTAKSTAYARVRVSTTLSRYYKTGRIGSTAYYWFHKNTDAVATTSMTYYKGRKQYLQLEIYSNGTWYSGAAEYFPVGTNGKSAVNLGHPGQSGIRARVRAAYINGSSGDVVNSTTYTGWKYLYFSN